MSVSKIKNKSDIPDVIDASYVVAIEGKRLFSSDNNGSAVYIGADIIITAGHVLLDEDGEIDDGLGPLDFTFSYNFSFSKNIKGYKNKEFKIDPNNSYIHNVFDYYEVNGITATEDFSLATVNVGNNIYNNFPSLIVFEDQNDASGDINTIGYPSDTAYLSSGYLETNSYYININNNLQDIWIADLSTVNGMSGSGVWLSYSDSAIELEGTYLAGIVSIGTDEPGFSSPTGIEPFGDIYWDLADFLNANGYSADQFGNHVLVGSQKTGSSLSGTFFNETIIGSQFDDNLNGQDGDDELFGKDGNDNLTGGAGDDVIDGGDGLLDTAIYQRSIDQYILAKSRDFLYIESLQTDEGQDVLINVEFLQFDGITYSIGSLFDDNIPSPKPKGQVPVAYDDEFGSSEDLILNGNLFLDNGFGADTDPKGDSFEVTEVNGSPYQIGDQAVVISDSGRIGYIVIQTDGSFTFDPAGNFNNLSSFEYDTITFSYRITDDKNFTSAQAANVYITVQGSAEVGLTIVGDLDAGSLAITDSVYPVGDTIVGGLVQGNTLTSGGGIIGNNSGAIGVAVVSGLSASWGIDGGVYGNLYVGYGGYGDLTIEAGASVSVDSGTDDIDISGDGRDIVIGYNNGSSAGEGHVTVEGGGSKLNTTGVDGSVSVGRDGGVGTLDVLDGASVETLSLQIGRSSGIGTVNVSGTDSRIDVFGQTSAPFQSSGAFVNVGRDGGSGELNINDSGVVQLSGPNSAAMLVGRGGGTGTVNIDDANSSLRFVGDDFPTNSGALHVGYGGDGVINVSNGGSIVMDSWDVTQFYVGGYVDAAGSGELYVDGSQSRIDITGGTGFTRFQVGGLAEGLARFSNGATFHLGAEDDFYSSVGVGDQGKGTLEILSGSQFIQSGLGDSVFMGVATNDGSEGNVLVSGAGSLLAVGGLDPGGTGSSINLSSSGSGKAALTIDNGGEVRTHDLLAGGNSMIFGEGGLLTAEIVRLEGAEIGLRGTIGTFEIDSDVLWGTFSGNPEADAFTINVDVAGNGMGNFDQTHITGSAQFVNSVPGLLRFDFRDGFAPVIGDEFAFLQAHGGITSAPDLSQVSYVVSGLADGFMADVQVTGDVLKLVATTSATAGDPEVDLFFGSNRDDNYNSGPGDDVLYGGGGNNYFAPGAGDDVVDGTGGYTAVGYEQANYGIMLNLNLATNQVQDDGFGGSDTLINIDQYDGSRHGDTLIGNGDGNLLRGLAGDDHIDGNSGDDILYGDRFYNDNFPIVGGNDTLIGGAGNDELYGDLRNDPTGAGGDDILDGGADDDLLEGHGGNDTYVFGSGYDHDRIFGFEAGQGTDDQVDVSSESVANFATLLTMISDNGSGNAELSLNGGDDTLEFIDVAKAQLHEDDFVL